MVCSLLIRFQDRTPEIAIIKPFALLLIGMVIGCCIHQDKLASQNWKQDKLLIYLLLVSMAGLLIRSPWSLIGETWQYVTALSMYFFASRLLKTRKDFIYLFIVMSLCISYMGNEAIVSVQMDPDPETNPHLDMNSRWQGIGYYENANEFGQLMVTTLPFLLGILLIRKNIILMVMAVFMIYIQVYVMAKSGSRTVMAVFGIMFILTFVLRSKGNILKKAIVGMVIVFVLLTVLSKLPGPLRDRLNTIRDARNDESFQGRTRSWGYGFRMLASYPITGVGKGQWHNHHMRSSHNSYVQVMAELGPVGITLFIWVLVLSYKEAIPFLYPKSTGPPGQNNQIEEADRTVVIAIVVTMSGWLIYIFLGNQCYSFWHYFYIGLCAALRNMLPDWALAEVNKKAEAS